MSLDLLSVLETYRIDAISTLMAAIIGCALTQRFLDRRGAASGMARPTFISVILVALAGIGVTETTTKVVDFPELESLARTSVAHAGVLGTALGIAAILLVSGARIALLQTKLRTRADMERQLELANSAADQANRVKSDFLTVMSHEIRTPLNAVMGFASLLGDSALDESQRGYVHTIKSEGARLEVMINDVLDLAKIEEGRLTLERMPFAPSETVHEVLRLLNARATEKKIDLRFEAQLAGPLLVDGDPMRFRQILLNLLDNAIKFTPRGTVTLWLNWEPPSGADLNGTLLLRVRDTGIGIPPAKLKDLFTLFMQADTSITRRYGGAGLGLAICQRLVTLMGGKISASSTHGEGSEFMFSLPMVPVPLPPTPKVVEPPAAITAVPAFAPRILVVDDMETNRFLLEIFLRRNGFDPELAAGGEEAIRLALETDYDAILMDLQMPDLDGYTATRRIRAAEPPGRHTPIIALTASIGNGTREKCLAAGMDEHLTKPLDLKRFKLILETFLGASVVAPGWTSST